MNLFDIAEPLTKLEVSEIKLSYARKTKAKDRLSCSSSVTSAEILRWALKRDNIEIDYQEAFYTIFLDRSNKVLAIEQIGKGGVTGTVADPKMIFQRALLLNASSMVLGHNHPSGNTKPSHQDKSLTETIVGAGKFLEISVLDHIIITAENYFSFADENLI